jgi:hypothetical protein
MEQLAAPVVARDDLVLILTGTAIVNRPRELMQQLIITGRIADFGSPGAFLTRYCEDPEKSNEHGRNFNGGQNLIELHDLLLNQGIMIRRADPKALGLPDYVLKPIHIPTDQLDPQIMAKYRQAEQDVISYLVQEARRIADRLGEDPDSAAVKAAMSANSAEHLVQLNALRKLIGAAKRDYAANLVGHFNELGEKVVIAAHHREVVTSLAKQFGGLKIQGSQSVTSKEADKAKFQNAPLTEAPAICVAIGAGGVGHTLTAARIGLQVEMPWTPGEMQQMLFRMYRIGQTRDVEYLALLAEGTVDDYMWDTVTTKQRVLDAVLDGKVADAVAESDTSAAAEVAWQLTQKGLRA